LFGKVTENNAELLVTNDYTNLDRREICLIGVDEIPKEIKGMLDTYVPSMDLYSVRLLLKESFEIAKMLYRGECPIRGYQEGILSHGNGFEETEFIEP